MSNEIRRLETRTKIQLGGLVIKAGLTDHFDIAVGEDLQRDTESLDKATTLLGALIHLADELASKEEMARKMFGLGLAHINKQ